MQSPIKSLSAFNHHAAFVAPIVYDQGQKYIVLGREAYGNDKGLYDAFGGKRDQADGNHPGNTASREFYEEAIAVKTLGLNRQRVKSYIALKSGHTEHVFAVQDRTAQGRLGARNVLYLTRFSPAMMSTFKNKFGKARAAAPRGKSFDEKDAIASISMNALKQAIVLSPSNSNVSVMAQVTDLKGRRSIQRIQLRTVTVKMLRGYFERRPYVKGVNNKIRFYTF